MIARSTKSFLLAWGLLAPVAAISATPLCGLIFRCGCTLTTGSRYCNIRNPAGPYCPWCRDPRKSALSFAASVAGASALMRLALKLRGPGVMLPAAAGAFGFWLTLSAAGLITAKVSSYPVWYGIRLESN